MGFLRTVQEGSCLSRSESDALFYWVYHTVVELRGWARLSRCQWPCRYANDLILSELRLRRSNKWLFLFPLSMTLLYQCSPGQLHHGLCHLILPFVSTLILHTSRSMTRSVTRASSYRRTCSKRSIRTPKRLSIKCWDNSWEQIWKDGDTFRYSSTSRIRQVIVRPSWSNPLL